MKIEKKHILIILLFIVLTIAGFFILPKEENVYMEESQPVDEDIFVHIEGEVVNPGLLKVKYRNKSL